MKELTKAAVHTHPHTHTPYESSYTHTRTHTVYTIYCQNVTLVQLQ